MEVIDCGKILRKVMNLNNTDVMVYKCLLKVGECRVENLSEILGKSRTTVQRSLNKLVKLGLCVRKRCKLNIGGHYYLYSAAEICKLKTCLEKHLDEWYASVKEEIKNIVASLSIE